MTKLDLFSTSQKKTCALEAKCIYNAPLLAYQISNSQWGLIQACCNHWNCPKCGILRAKHEYGRIVNGCRILSEQHKLYFLTITCRGLELTVREAEAHYLEWTNRFLSTLRARSKAKGGQWHYVQVTERQTRKHPHSHILTTFSPGDLVEGAVQKYERTNDGRLTSYWQEALRSYWLQIAVCRSGLGDQYDISVVETAEGASRYVSKYLFKPSVFTDDWPKGWKRVRYSHKFPPLERKDSTAFPLKERADWYKLSRLASRVVVSEAEAYETARINLRLSDTIVTLKRRDDTQKIGK